MKRMALLLILAATSAAAACLQKDTTSTMYLRRDGSFDWVVLEQNVRSDANDEAARLDEEAGYTSAVAGGEIGTVHGFLALGGDDIRVRWLRRARPYAVMVDARFDSLARVFDRMLSPCGIPYESVITESDGVTTWTLVADVGVGGERLDGRSPEACGQGLAELSDAFETLRIVLESGHFTAATGFTIQGAVAAVMDEKAVEESVTSAGVVEISLSWR